MGMGLKQFFYHCLRKGEVDIPEDMMIDARRRRVGYFNSEEVVGPNTQRPAAQ